jgi:hypothetical protein
VVEGFWSEMIVVGIKLLIIVTSVNFKAMF